MKNGWLTEREINDYESFRELVDRLVVVRCEQNVGDIIREYSTAVAYAVLLKLQESDNRKKEKLDRRILMDKVVSIVKSNGVSIIQACELLKKDILKSSGYSNVASLATAVYKRKDELGVGNFISSNKGRQSSHHE